MLNFLYDLATDKKRGFIASLIKFLLYVLSLIYGIGVRGLIFLSGLKRHRLNCKVISVGNITLGGTGKTSLVEFIARYLKKEGKRIAILTRGYKRNSKLKTQNSKPSYETMGDEPYMLFKNLKDVPVIVNKDRIKASKQAIEDYNADTVILDDGFQQWKILKDLEIVTIDATDPFGNQHLLPRGILRQPLSSLKKADILVLTKTNLNPDIQDIKNFLTQINPSGLVVEATHKPIGFYRIEDSTRTMLDIDILKGNKVSLLSGIADPDSFENLIISLGINIANFFRFPDHHHYGREDMDRVIQKSKQKGTDIIITTEKDAVRLLNTLHITHYTLHIYVLRIKLEIVQDEIFTQRIHSLY